MSETKRPIVTSWMRGYHAAKIEHAEFLRDVPTEELSQALVHDWYRLEQEMNSEPSLSDDVYTELRAAYTEIGEKDELIIELRKLLRLANERI